LKINPTAVSADRLIEGNPTSLKLPDSETINAQNDATQELFDVGLEVQPVDPKPYADAILIPSHPQSLLRTSVKFPNGRWLLDSTLEL